MEKSTRMLTPKRRFPEFRSSGKWKSDLIADVATISKGKGISKADVTKDGATPCIRYAELYTLYGEVINEVRSHTNISPEDLVLSRAEDVILPASGETRADIATAACVMRDGVALGGDLNILRSDLHGPFFSYLLNSPLRYMIAQVAQGDTVVHLYPSQISTISIAYPSLAEQQKIAECLSSLDEVITAEGRKLEALKDHKRGLMQRLFPQPGETQPRLRFPEFRGKGEWQKRKITSLLTKSASPVRVKANEAYREIGIRSHGNGIFHKEPVRGKALGEKRVFWVEDNAFVLNIVFAWEQAVAVTSVAERGMIASHRFPMYKAKLGKSDVGFIKYFFLTNKGKELLGIASPGGAGRNKTLGQKAFENLEFLSPVQFEEQVKIARCLSSIDELIYAKFQKISTLIAHKRGLMQQLFPAPEEQ